MSTSNPKKAEAPEKSLKITTIVYGATGMALWAASIGVMIGWDIDISAISDCEHGGLEKITYGWFVSVPANAASVYVTARIIFLITSPSFPNPALLADLSECVARMVAFTVLILTMWAASLSWLVKDGCELNVVYHVCNYGFIFSTFVAGFAGRLYKVTSKKVMLQERLPAGKGRHVAPPPTQTHNNQAYIHHPTTQGTASNKEELDEEEEEFNTTL